MKPLRIIINADDCGYSYNVNEHIRLAIEKRHVSSTTVMASMEDFEGAVRLYDDFKDFISFGFHINLTEGHPMRNSQLLLDLGFYLERNGSIVYNAQPFRRKKLSEAARVEIYKEVLAQAERILDSGIRISHIDGHHFIHQSIFMIPILPRLCKEISANKVRNYRNYMPCSLNRWMRGLWMWLIKERNSNVLTTDWFTSFEDFIKLEENSMKYNCEGDSIELMCHPGGKYTDEEMLLMNTGIVDKLHCKLINYNQL